MGDFNQMGFSRPDMIDFLFAGALY